MQKIQVLTVARYQDKPTNNDYGNNRGQKNRYVTTGRTGVSHPGSSLSCQSLTKRRLIPVNSQSIRASSSRARGLTAKFLQLAERTNFSNRLWAPISLVQSQISAGAIATQRPSRIERRSCRTCITAAVVDNVHTFASSKR